MCKWGKNPFTNFLGHPSGGMALGLGYPIDSLGGKTPRHNVTVEATVRGIATLGTYEIARPFLCRFAAYL